MSHKNIFKVFLSMVFFALVSFLLLTVINNFSKLENNNSQIFSDYEGSIFFSKIEYSKDVFFYNDFFDIELEIQNLGHETDSVFLGYSVLSPLNKWIDFPVKEVSLSKGSNKVTISLKILDFQLKDMVSGPYKAVFALWDSSPVSEPSNRLTEFRVNNAFHFYNHIENFDSLDNEIWFSRKGILGRTKLNPDNLEIKDNQLVIKLPANTFDGGELQSIDMFHYGSYEINMKLPDAPSSITGFFLYKSPDFYHEIDIEIFNEKDGNILFTTYYNGDAYNETVYQIEFDPTSDFNRYRIDYFPNEVAFYVNDQLMERFIDGFSHEPMHLIINTWYPRWLEGLAPSEDKFLLIDWIRY